MIKADFIFELHRSIIQGTFIVKGVSNWALPL